MDSTTLQKTLYLCLLIRSNDWQIYGAWLRSPGIHAWAFWAAVAGPTAVYFDNCDFTSVRGYTKTVNPQSRPPRVPEAASCSGRPACRQAGIKWVKTNPMVCEKSYVRFRNGGQEPVLSPGRISAGPADHDLGGLPLYARTLSIFPERYFRVSTYPIPILDLQQRQGSS